MRGRHLANLTALAACIILLSSCGGSDECDVPEVTGVQPPEEILPSPEECPEFYEGDPDGGGYAPPVPNQPPPVDLPEPAPPPPAPGLEPGEHDIPSQPAPPYYPGY